MRWAFRLETFNARRARLASGCFVTLVALSVAGCADHTDAPTAVPTAWATDDALVFASEEQALAAATEVYAMFLATTDAVLAEHGKSPERLDEFASPDVAAIEMASVEEFVANDYQLVGRARVTNTTLQSHAGSNSTVELPVAFYVCVDITEVDVLDRDGVSVVEPTRPDSSTFEVIVDQRHENSSELEVVSKNVWAGKGVC
jgi:hypothetical protein